MSSLQRIPVEQLVPGMIVEQLDVPWSQHPFAHARFTVKSEQDAVHLLNSGVRTVWISPAPAADPLPRPPVAQRSLAEEIVDADRLRLRALQTVRSFYDAARLGHLQQQNNEMAALVEDISRSIVSNSAALLTLVRLRSRDEYTYLHSVAVAVLMVGLAQQLGLPEEQVRDAGIGGMLHDIGKMMVPLEILNKPGRLTPEEYETAKIHPAEGYALLRRVGTSQGVLDAALHHHEKMDGSGYPRGLAGTDIPLMARMGAICDVYDALTSERSYKTPWSPPAALSSMSEWKGHFDPQLLRTFIEMVGIYPAGTLVRLASGYVAIVMDQSDTSLLTPTVSTIYDTRDRVRVAPRRIDLTTAEDHIVSTEAPETWGLHDIVPLWRELASEQVAR